jgi:yersiniabactin nonribosomal peptide synthetase
MTFESVRPGQSPTAGELGESIEAALAGIWSELLDLDPATIPTDVGFLRLGGDSVLAVRMSALVRKRLGVMLALSDVRVETTLAELAEMVNRRAAGGAARALPVELTRRPDPAAPFPLLPLQQGYFVGQHDGWELSYDSAHFYVDVGLEAVDEDEAAEALEDGLRRLAAHQPTLRSRITVDGRQHILPADDPAAVPSLRVHDLRDVSPEQARSALGQVRREMSTAGPDPRHGAGVDVRLTLLPEGRGRLHTAISLLVVDGWSASVLNRELLALTSDWNAVLPPLETDFGDYVTALERLPETEVWRADRDWWWDRLDDAPLSPALPLRRDPQTVRPDLMGTREARLDSPQWALLRGQCARHEVTPSTALLTAFAIVLARWSGHRRMLLNSLQLNRLPLHPDVHRVIGAFASTMLLPVELAAGASFAELARYSQRLFGEHASHNLVPGVEVARELGRRRGTRRPVAPVVFQSTLGLDAAIGETPPRFAGPLGEVVIDDYHQQLRTPQVALEIRLFELSEQLVVVFSLVEELFEPEQVDRAFAELLDLARALTDPAGWERVVELPDALDPSAEGLRLGQVEARGHHGETGLLGDELELRIAAVWEELLEVPVLDRGDDFFALGGDSLLAIRVLARLAKQDGISVGIRDFLDAPTVAALAAIARAGAPA